MRTAIYPGTFDPITNGHLDILERALKLFDKVIITIARNSAKNPLFSEEERLAMIRESVKHLKGVEIDCFDGLLVDYGRQKKATAVVRGLRAISDFEYELQMALMNRRLRPDIETVFLMAGEAYSFISSRLVKQVIGLGGNISGLVPPLVEVRLRDRLLGEKPGR